MKQVLIIEDNEDNMKLISFILEKHGFQTLKAYSGEEGISRIISHQPDLVLLDIQLPDIDGYEVLCRVRNLACASTLPIVAVTSYAMSGDRDRLLAAGCTGYIEKPIDPATIIDEINKFIGDTPCAS